jgi:hypothetical protein
MNNVTRYLTAVAFSVAGAAAHANAAVEKNACGSATCFQLTPLENGAAVLAENGASRTTQGQWLERQTV